jgi:hypothetical protein
MRPMLIDCRGKVGVAFYRLSTAILTCASGENLLHDLQQPAGIVFPLALVRAYGEDDLAKGRAIHATDGRVGVLRTGQQPINSAIQWTPLLIVSPLVPVSYVAGSNSRERSFSTK